MYMYIYMYKYMERNHLLQPYSSTRHRGLILCQSAGPTDPSKRDQKKKLSREKTTTIQKQRICGSQTRT